MVSTKNEDGCSIVYTTTDNTRQVLQVLICFDHRACHISVSDAGDSYARLQKIAAQAFKDSNGGCTVWLNPDRLESGFINIMLNPVILPNKKFNIDYTVNQIVDIIRSTMPTI